MEQLESPIQKQPEHENVKGYENPEAKFNKPKNCLKQTSGTFQNNTQVEETTIRRHFFIS